MADKSLLRELKLDPRWKKVLDEIQRYPLPEYRPRKSGESKIQGHEDQVNNWIYMSAAAKVSRDIYNLLSLEGDTDE